MAVVRFKLVGGAVQRVEGVPSLPTVTVAVPVAEPTRDYRESLAYRALCPTSVPMPDVTTVRQVEADFDRAVKLSASIWGRRWQKKGAGGNVIGPSISGGFVGNPSQALVPTRYRALASEIKTPIPAADPTRNKIAPPRAVGGIQTSGRSRFDPELVMARAIAEENARVSRPDFIGPVRRGPTSPARSKRSTQELAEPSHWDK